MDHPRGWTKAKDVGPSNERMDSTQTWPKLVKYIIKYIIKHMYIYFIATRDSWPWHAVPHVRLGRDLMLKSKRVSAHAFPSDRVPFRYW